jgi:hypothetical protein
MEPGEALGIAAQIAVTLVGFAGVVVVFRRESVHEWAPVDRLRLRLLLTNSILPLCLCMMGLLLLSIKPMPPGMWRWVQRYRIRRFFTVRNYKRENLWPFGCATRQTRASHRYRLLCIRSGRHASHCLATVQHCVAWSILAILHWDCLPIDCRCFPVCTHDPFAARIEAERSRFMSSIPAKVKALVRCHEAGCNQP